jgi:hypothetical protein
MLDPMMQQKQMQPEQVPTNQKSVAEGEKKEEVKKAIENEAKAPAPCCMPSLLSDLLAFTFTLLEVNQTTDPPTKYISTKRLTDPDQVLTVFLLFLTLQHMNQLSSSALSMFGKLRAAVSGAGEISVSTCNTPGNENQSGGYSGTGRRTSFGSGSSKVTRNSCNRSIDSSSQPGTKRITRSEGKDVQNATNDFMRYSDWDSFFISNLIFSCSSLCTNSKYFFRSRRSQLH